MTDFKSKMRTKEAVLNVQVIFSSLLRSSFEIEVEISKVYKSFL